MRYLIHVLSRAHRRETARERALCNGRRALDGVRRDSVWLGKRPFGDRHGYDGVGHTPASGWRDNDSWATRGWRR